jgi:hypothetical protein
MHDGADGIQRRVVVGLAMGSATVSPTLQASVSCPDTAARYTKCFTGGLMMGSQDYPVPRFLIYPEFVGDVSGFLGHQVDPNCSFISLLTNAG